MDLIGIIAWGVLIVVILVFLILGWIEKSDKKKMLEWEKKFVAGKPTYKGKLVNVEYSAGGFGITSITTITLGNRVILVGGYVEPLVIGKMYKFWVTRSKRVLKFEEVGE